MERSLKGAARVEPWEAVPVPVFLPKQIKSKEPEEFRFNRLHEEVIGGEVKNAGGIGMGEFDPAMCDQRWW